MYMLSNSFVSLLYRLSSRIVSLIELQLEMLLEQIKLSSLFFFSLLPGKTRQFNPYEGHKASQPAATYCRKGKVLLCVGDVFIIH